MKCLGVAVLLLLAVAVNLEALPRKEGSAADEHVDLTQVIQSIAQRRSFVNAVAAHGPVAYDVDYQQHGDNSASGKIVISADKGAAAGGPVTITLKLAPALCKLEGVQQPQVPSFTAVVTLQEEVKANNRDIVKFSEEDEKKLTAAPSCAAYICLGRALGLIVPPLIEQIKSDPNGLFFLGWPSSLVNGRVKFYVSSEKGRTTFFTSPSANSHGTVGLDLSTTFMNGLSVDGTCAQWGPIRDGAGARKSIEIKVRRGNP